MTILGGGGLGGPVGGDKSAAVTIPFITEGDFEPLVLRSELPVFMEFTADWCQPCKQIAPEVAAFAQEVQGKITVVKVDIDKAQFLARQMRVQSVPTFMLFAEQRVADVQVGAISRKQMRAMVEPYLPRQQGLLKPIELAHLLKESAAVAVDTRDASAFARAHIPGATNIPHDEVATRLAELYMLGSQPVLYCRSGDKSKDLAVVLDQQGVPTAFLEGGFLAWEAEGLPVERP